jgi:hypothetical protein
MTLALKVPMNSDTGNTSALAIRDSAFVLLPHRSLPKFARSFPVKEISTRNVQSIKTRCAFTRWRQQLGRR